MPNGPAVVFTAIGMLPGQSDRQYQVYLRDGSVDFIYVGVPAEQREPRDAPMASGGLLGVLFAYFRFQKDVARKDELDVDASRMLTTIAETTEPEMLLRLHTYNFRVRADEIADSQFLNSVPRRRQGTFWQFHRPQEQCWLFRLISNRDVDDPREAIEMYLSRHKAIE